MDISSICADLNCTKSGLAKRLGVSRAVISIWGKNQKIPLARQYQIRDLLEGKNPIGVADESFHTPESATSKNMEVVNSQDDDFTDDTAMFADDAF